MKHRNPAAAVAMVLVATLSVETASPQEARPSFDVQEKTIAQIQQAIVDKEITIWGAFRANRRRRSSGSDVTAA